MAIAMAVHRPISALVYGCKVLDRCLFENVLRGREVSRNLLFFMRAAYLDRVTTLRFFGDVELFSRTGCCALCAIVVTFTTSIIQFCLLLWIVQAMFMAMAIHRRILAPVYGSYL